MKQVFSQRGVFRLAPIVVILFIDISIKLGVDSNQSDQNVRGAVTLPNSLGKEVTVAVFADGDQASAAKQAGADFIGMEDLAEKFTKEEIIVDVVISTNAAMKVVGKLGQVLGPKGLMPNPKTGTVSDDIPNEKSELFSTAKVLDGAVKAVNKLYAHNIITFFKNGN